MKTVSSTDASLFPRRGEGKSRYASDGATGSMAPRPPMRGEHPLEVQRRPDLHHARVQRVAEREPADVPLRQPLRGRDEHEVLVVAGRLEADLGRRAVEQEPVAAVVLDVEDEHEPAVGQLVGLDVLAEAPQHRAGVVVLRGHVQPLLAPAGEHVDDLVEPLARLGQAVLERVVALDDPVVLEHAQALGEHGARDARQARRGSP